MWGAQLQASPTSRAAPYAWHPAQHGARALASQRQSQRQEQQQQRGPPPPLAAAGWAAAGLVALLVAAGPAGPAAAENVRLEDVDSPTMQAGAQGAVRPRCKQRCRRLAARRPTTRLHVGPFQAYRLPPGRVLRWLARGLYSRVVAVAQGCGPRPRGGWRRRSVFSGSTWCRRTRPRRPRTATWAMCTCSRGARNRRWRTFRAPLSWPPLPRSPTSTEASPKRRWGWRRRRRTATPRPPCSCGTAH